MRKFRIFAVLAATVMFCLTYTSCDELENAFGGGDKDSEEAFFPSAYANKTVAAWYLLTENEDNKTRTEAVFLFDDNTLVVTKYKVYSKDDGRDPERSIIAEGAYRLTQGDYTNGTASVVLSDGSTMEVTITDGKLYAMKETFTKQDKSKVPAPKQPTGKNDDGGNNNQGNNNQGGDSISNSLEPFFPNEYKDKEVSAWYSYSGSNSYTDSISGQGGEIKFIASIYFFKDNSFVSTSSVLAPGLNGETVERIVSMSGRYRLEGDFTKGKLTLISDSLNITLEINDGKITFNDIQNGQTSVLSIQDISSVPKASDPTQNENWGGNNNPQGGDIVNHYTDSIYSQLAYYPAKFANKDIYAWYMLVDQYPQENPIELRVEAIFLFKDKTFALTEFKAHYEANAKPDYNLLAEGTYNITQGDYTNGWAEISPYNGNYFEVKVSNGELYAQNSTYYLQSTRPMVTEIDNDPQGGDDNTQSGDSISNSKLAAWYSGTITSNGSEYNVDIILLEDYTVAFTRTRTPDNSGNIYMTEIYGIGNYKILDGDFTDGKILIEMYGEPQEFKVSNGMITISTDGESVTFYKQDNAKYQGPTDFTESGNNGGDDDPQGGDISHITDSIYSQIAYFPTKYVDKQVNAWYVLASTEDQKIRVEAVYLFTDNTLAVTKSKYYTDGRSPEFDITAEGQYRISEGDYTTGKAMVVTADDNMFEVTIENGKLSVPMGENGANIVFNKMSNSQLPEAYNPNDNPQGGNDDPQGGDDNGGQTIQDSLLNAYAQFAFLPNSYAKKEISAWFMLAEQKEKATDIRSMFFFSDNTAIITVTSIGNSYGVERFIAMEFSYRIENNFDNGGITVIYNGQQYKASIQGGVLNADNVLYYRQSIDNLPEPSDAISDDDNPGNDDPESGDDVTGQQTFNEDIIMPYLPEKYTDKVIAAWYLNADVQEAKIKLESVFLFDDNTLVVTKAKFYSIEDGRDPEYGIIAEGTYELGRGDYNTGAATVTLSDGSTMTVMITNGVMQAMNEEFTLQSNETEIVEEGKIIGEE